MIAQYANSPKFVKLVNGLKDQFNNSKTIEDWFNVVYNLKTAAGFGLDIWGVILNQSRLISYDDNGVTEVVLLRGAQTIDGVSYTAEQMEEYYRLVLFLKSMCYITNATVKSLNDMLQFYFGGNKVYVLEYNPMEIRYVFEVFLTKLEKAIFTSDVMPKPTGVEVSFEFLPLGEFFGFHVSSLLPEEQPYAPIDNKPFYW